MAGASTDTTSSSRSRTVAVGAFSWPEYALVGLLEEPSRVSRVRAASRGTPSLRVMSSVTRSGHEVTNA